MFRRGAAAAADHVEEARLRPFLNLGRHGVGIKVVLAESVRQTGVRVRGHVAFGNARQFLDVLAQFVRAEGAVQAEGQSVGVAQGIVERFGRLAGERTPGGVGDGAGNHDRQVNAQRFKLFFHRKDCRFGVQGIEDRFNQNQVATALHQRFGGFAIGRHQLIESHVTVSRVVDIR